MSVLATGRSPESRPGSLDEAPVGRGPVRVLRARGVVTGVLVAAAVYAVLASGALSWVVSWGLVIAVVVLVPTAADFARRVALNGSLVIGWIQVLWWVPVRFELNHAALVAGVAAGALGYVVVASAEPRGRMRRLVPAFHAGDLLVVASGFVALGAVYKLAFAGTPTRALSFLLPGADNYVHFNLFSGMRTQGSTLDVAAAPPNGSGWAFDFYPTGFHALLASISEVTQPHLARSTDALSAYAHGLAVLVVVGMVVVTAAITSLPRLRDRPGLAAPAIVLVWSAYLFEPGQKALANGFGSFWLGSLAAGIALVLCIAPSRPHALLQTAAVSGLIVVIAHTWTPLLVPAVAAPLLILFDRDSEITPQERRRRVTGCLAIFAVAGLATLKAVVVLFRNVDVKFLVRGFGGIDGTSPLPTFALLVMAFYVFLSYPAWTSRRGDHLDVRTPRRVRRLVVAPVLAIALAVVIFVAQMQAIGTTSYYFLKFFMGTELILVVVVPAVTAMLAASVTRPRPRRVGIAVSVLGCLLASQAFGLMPGHKWMLLSETDDGTAALSGRYSRVGVAEGIVAAAQHTSPAASIRLEYLALGPGAAASAFYADGWYHGVNASLTTAGMGRLSTLTTRVDDVQEAAPVVTKVLASAPDVRILVAPAYLTPLRSQLPPELARRVVSWAP